MEVNWTPCAERLPESRVFYLCTLRRASEDPYTAPVFYNGRDFCGAPVTAWTPIPEPWDGSADSGWISCGERLPDVPCGQEQNVMTTVVSKQSGVRYTDFDCYICSEYGSGFEFSNDNSDIIAWAWMPEPWEGGLTMRHTAKTKLTKQETIEEARNNCQRAIDRSYVEEVSKWHCQSRREAKEAECCEILFADGKTVGIDRFEDDDNQAGGNHDARHQ